MADFSWFAVRGLQLTVNIVGLYMGYLPGTVFIGQQRFIYNKVFPRFCCCESAFLGFGLSGGIRTGLTVLGGGFFLATAATRFDNVGIFGF